MLRECQTCRADISDRGSSAKWCRKCAKERQRTSWRTYARKHIADPAVQEQRAAYQREYFQRPEVKERQRERHRRPDFVAKKREQEKEYRQRPDVKERKAAYQREFGQRPEAKARKAARNQTPKAKEQARERQKRRRSDPQIREEHNAQCRERYHKMGGRGYRRNLGLLVRNQNGMCGICHKALPKTFRYVDVDHIVPVSLGGTSELENLQATHKFCNQSKHDNIGAGVAPKLLEVA